MTTLRLLAALTTFSMLTACGVGEITMGGEYEELSSEDLAAYEAELAANAKFEIFQGRDGRHYFHLLAGNGEKVLQSEGYSTATAAKNGIVSVKSNGQYAGRYVIKEASNGAHYFVLKATNGQVIALSEMFATRYSAERSVNTVSEIVKASASQPLPVTTGVRFESFRGLDAKYYFHLRAANGQIVLQSQGYTSATGRNAGIASVQSNGTDAARFQVLPAADGKYYFTLKALNGRVIGWGETYASLSGAEAAVTTVTQAVEATKTEAAPR